jgi:hypothetical protein
VAPVRRELNNHRAVLGNLAAELYPDATRVGTTADDATA